MKIDTKIGSESPTYSGDVNNHNDICGIYDSSEDYDEDNDIFDDDDFYDDDTDHNDIFYWLGSEKGYERVYSVLSKDELIELINQAHEEGWDFLDLSDCGLTEIPREIGNLIKLKTLNLENNVNLDLNNDHNDRKRNNILTLPPEIGNLQNLENLSLYSCGLTALPQEFADLKNLKYLNMNRNEITVFPEQICQLINLENLAIDGHFSTIPSSISNLKNLKKLYLPDSFVEVLPDSIGDLINLEVLYLGRSKITRLPNSMRKLDNLARLSLDDSIIAENIPPEILTQNPHQVIEYIIKYQNKDEVVEIYESKVIIVGQGGVGKTSLFHQIVNERYIEDLSTEGIDIQKWSYSHRDINYTLNIWDFGGQEIYHSTHQFFLTKRALYIFVWDARQEEEYGRIDYWLNTIESFAGESPILIVVNKCDESRRNIQEIDKENLKNNFPQILDFYYVSCKNNININELRTRIKEEAVILPLMKTTWFISWIVIRKKLEDLSRKYNYIDFRRYLEICTTEGIDEAEAKSLIRYLHDLGVVIHFEDDILLRNTIILSPEWGTDAVYKILDSQSNVLKGRNGILKTDDLPLIWAGQTMYPTSLYPFILKLMEKFQLSFKLSDDDVYLIAELLEISEARLETPIEGIYDLSLIYEYGFLAAGIMTKFIVRMNKYIMSDGVKLLCWKKGCYLKHKDALAKVTLNDSIKKRYVKIAVFGDTRSDVRELMSLIKITFDSIHEGISKLDAVTKVKCNCSELCDYLHDYKYLVKLDDHGILSERCKNSLKEVQITSLLDGILKIRERDSTMNKIEITNAPVINITASSSNENQLTNTNTITIEIRTAINELEGCLKELHAEVEEDEIKADTEKMHEDIMSLGKVSSKDDVVKSGKMNRVKRFLCEMENPESGTSKAIRGCKNGISIVQDIAEKYNSIAEWCGMPVVPRVFLKKK